MGRILLMDIVELSILPRLPVKSLLRFKCVSKSWQTLISSHNFILLHNNLSSDKNRVHIFPGDAYTLHLHYLDSPLAPLSFCPYPYPSAFPKQTSILHPQFKDEMTILASCEFFLLVSRWFSHSSGLILLNPFTRLYREIPDIVQDETILSGIPKYELSFDEAHDDLKVFRLVGCFYGGRSNGWKITIFSLRTNVWTLLETKPMMNPSYHTTYKYLCVNKNLLYLLFCYYAVPWYMRIGCFDIRAERWINDIPLPPNLDISHLSVFDGSLCALGSDGKERTFGTRGPRVTKEYTWSVWVMKDYSWVKLMTILTTRVRDRYYSPIAYRKGSRHEILCRQLLSAELFWYNLRDKEITKADFKGFPEDGSKYSINLLDHICKESLMSFPTTLPSGISDDVQTDA